MKEILLQCDNATSLLWQVGFVSYLQTINPLSFFEIDILICVSKTSKHCKNKISINQLEIQLRFCFDAAVKFFMKHFEMTFVY